jgi:hypothetical protein
MKKIQNLVFCLHFLLCSLISFCQKVNSQHGFSNSTRQDDPLFEKQNKQKPVELLIEEQVTVYKRQMLPNKNVHDDESAKDLESSHDYFKQLATLRLEFQMKLKTSNNSTAKLEEKIDELLQNEKKSLDEKGMNHLSRTISTNFNPVTKDEPETEATRRKNRKTVSKGCKKFRIALISDLDEHSKKDNNVYKAFMKLGNLITKPSEDLYELSWEKNLKEITSGYSFKGEKCGCSKINTN